MCNAARQRLETWRKNVWTDLLGPYAYRVWVVTLTTFVGAYFGLYAVMEARHDRVLNRALFERNAFITMVSSGNRNIFVAAMKEFGAVQTMTAPRAPSPLEPWRWLETGQPNMEQLHRWAIYRLPHCVQAECGPVVRDSQRGGIDMSNADPECATREARRAYRIDLINANLQGAKLKDTMLYLSDFRGANLMHADLRGAELDGSNLRSADLRHADLRGADLGDADLDASEFGDSDLRGADILNATLRDPDRTCTVEGASITVHGRSVNLRGADLRKLRNWTREQLAKAYWDERTVWPSGYRPPCPHNLPDDLCDKVE